MTAPATLPPDVIDILEHMEARSQPERSLIRQVSRAPRRFHLAMLLVMVWGIVLLGLSGMATVSLYDPIAWMRDHTVTWMPYTFQVPAVILVAALLGARYGGITMLIALILGFSGLPLFANGGGPAYLQTMSVGYLAGFLLVPGVLRPFLRKAFATEGWLKGRSLWLLLGVCLAVLTVHTVGVIGLMLQGVVHHLDTTQLVAWGKLLTWPALVYDMAFGWVAVALVRWLRILLWFCLY